METYKSHTAEHESPKLCVVDLPILTEAELNEPSREIERTEKGGKTKANILPEDCKQYAVPTAIEKTKEQKVKRKKPPVHWMNMKY